MSVPVHYAERGFRTRRGAMVLATGILMAHGNVLLAHGVRTGRDAATVAAAAWLLVLLLATSAALRQLGALEQTEAQGSPSMRLAFRLVLVLPIVGTLPLWFLFVGRP